MEEAPVFNGGDGVHHYFWDVVVLDEPALGAGLAVKKAGDELGLKFVSAEAVAAVAERGDAINQAFFHTNDSAFSVVIGGFAGLDLNGVLQNAIGAEL